MTTINKKYTVQYRRKREGKTDYKQRLALIKSGQPRLVIRKSQKHILIQITEYSPTGDKVKLSTHTAELKKLGWKGATANTPAAYLCGRITAKKAKEKNITKCITDLGRYTSVKGSILYAAIKGAQDYGLKLSCPETVYPDQNRIKGDHITKWASTLKKQSQEKYNTQFQKTAPENTAKQFEETTNKIP